MIQYARYRDGKDRLLLTLLTPMEKKALLAWRAMKNRCYNFSCPQYKNYGGRGILVSEEFFDDFQAFFDHVGAPPGGEHSIERIDTNKNYERDNLTWATLSEQNRNKRNNHLVDIGPRGRVTIAEASEISGVPFDTIWQRAKQGWTGEKLLLPVWGNAKERQDDPLDIEGVTKTFREWTKIIGVTYFCLRQRVKRGLTGKDLLAPSRCKNPSGPRNKA